MLTPFKIRALILFFLTAATAGRAGVEWRYATGLHDMIVPEADNSNTWGVDFMAVAEETRPSGIHWLASGEVLLDRDKDELDPDHIPVWWRVHAGVDGAIARLSGGARVLWVADFDTRVNTVSSIEREIRALPGVVLDLKAGACSAQLKAAAGYFFLEIDDDVPRERGYDRGDFRHTAFTGSLAADGAIPLSQAWRLLAHAQGWWDQDDWLESQYRAELDFAPRGLAHGAIIALSAEFTRYNLDPYSPADAMEPHLPILPWDHDWLLKLSYATRW